MPQKTLVLDLDETLIHSLPDTQVLGIYSNPELFKKFHPIGKPQLCFSTEVDLDGKIVKVWGLKRPGLEEFLKFAQKYFDNIIIWSAGECRYVNNICRQIFDVEGLKMPKAIWTRNECIPLDTQTGYHKPLSLLSRLENLGIDLNNTIIVDDRPHTFKNNPNNGVLIPPYNPGIDIAQMTDRSDKCLFDLIKWLTNIKSTENLTILNKSQIFSSG